MCKQWPEFVVLILLPWPQYIFPSTIMIWKSVVMSFLFDDSPFWPHRQKNNMGLEQLNASWTCKTKQYNTKLENDEQYQCKKALLFSRAVLCCLTWNSLGTEVSCRRRADDVRTTHGQCADDTRVRLHWRFQVADDIHHPRVVRMSSTGEYVIHTSSAALLMVTIVLNYLCTVTGIGYWMEFGTKMLSCFIWGSYKWFAR